MSLTLTEQGMRIWLVCCGSIRGLIISFAPNGSYCRSSCFRYCRSRFRSKRVILSLTLKERGMHIWLVYCGSIPSIDYFFRSKRVILSLTLKERGIHIWLVCCRSRFRYCRSRFRSKRVTLCSHLKNEVYMHVWFALLWQMQFSTYNFPIVYGPKTVLTIRTNRTDRQTAVTPSLE